MSAAAWVTPRLFLRDLVTPSCPCASHGLNALDRGVAATSRKAPAIASDVLIGATYLSAFALDAVDVGNSHGEAFGWLQDATVIAETLTLNGALAQGAKLAFQRPRPLLYGRTAGDPARRDPDNYLSFYSEHTSAALAAGLSYAQTFALRHPQSPYRSVVYAGAVVLGSGIGSLRILSGKHFPTDVLTGAVVGSALGLLVPWLRLRAPDVQLSAAVLPTGAWVGASVALH